MAPKDTVFFDLFEGLARHGMSAAQNLRELARTFPEITAPLQKIREDEHAADELAHSALDRLDRAFFPFDRVDIHTLVRQLDDIVDTIDALAKRFPLFHVERMEQGFAEQADLLVAATGVVSEAVHRLRAGRKLAELRRELAEIHQKESVGDDNHHAAISRLFSGNTDALDVMKWKELHDFIEHAIDRCEDVGNTLERIMLRQG